MESNGSTKKELFLDSAHHNRLNRYNRQMLLPNIGLEGQLKLENTKVLIVGAGGIGSTVAMYLAGAGVKLTIMDFDIVELSNLHRQIIHFTSSIGKDKVSSAKETILNYNPNCDCEIIHGKLSTDNALEIINQHHLVIDASDNYDCRYIINDACVITNKPFISGSAIGFEGQITVILPRKSACYRCLYPTPSLADNCSCSNKGVLGPIPGMIGCLEAIEAVKLIISDYYSHSNSMNISGLVGKQLFFDGLFSDFHTFELPSKSLNCQICGLNSTQETLEETKSFIDTYTNESNEKTNLYKGDLDPESQISIFDFHKQMNGSKTIPRLILDVRSKTQFSLINLSILPNTINFSSLKEAILSPLLFSESEDKCIVLNIPLSEMTSNPTSIFEQLDIIEQKFNLTQSKWFVICRRGIDSMVATRFLLSKGNVSRRILNVEGGLLAWKMKIDENFPFY